MWTHIQGRASGSNSWNSRKGDIARSSGGPGRLAVRDRGVQSASNENPEQEKTLLRAENQAFKKLQSDMVKAGVGVDFFLMAPAGGYLDIATIGMCIFIFYSLFSTDPVDRSHFFQVRWRGLLLP